ncbi:Transcriptional regulator, GntR family / Transcriptional regulator, TetR family protein [Minicystis rosea]|nr:Transcriptional regulator, GntR family / Transcriptional regulator, TetR family protein [Minicystis rosea]
MKQNTASQRVVAALRARIRSGALAPGAPVPSARQIVREHGVALATAAKVLATLRRERLVRVVPGVGTIVRGPDDGPDLSREHIVETAIAIADDEGLAALSMRGVAAEMGVATMSLYRHVPSKDELLLSMIDAVMAEQPLPARGTRGWRSRLEAIARLHWEKYARHPWLSHALSLTRPQASPNGMVHTEWVLEALTELGLDPATALRTGVAFIGYIRGMAMSVEPERQAEQDTGMNSDEWMNAHEATFAPLTARFPTLARLSQGPDVDMGLDAIFESGLCCFLDGIEHAFGDCRGAHVEGSTDGGETRKRARTRPR